MHRIFAFPIRYPVLALVLLGVFTLFFAYKIPDVEIQTNPWDFLGPKTGERLYYNEIAEKFGAEDGVLIAMVSDDGIFDRETLGKISRLTEAIESINILDKSDTELLEEAIERSRGEVRTILESVQAEGLGLESMGELSRAVSLIEESTQKDEDLEGILQGILVDMEPIEEVTSLTSIDQVKGTSWGMEVAPLVEDFDLTEDELRALEETVLSNDLYRGMIISNDAKVTGIMVNLSFPETDSDRAIKVYYQLMSIIDSIGGPERIHVAGVPMASALAGENVSRDLNFLLPAVIIVVIIVLFISFGNISGVILPLSVVLMSVIWSVGAISWLHVPFSIILSSMPMLLVAVGSAYGIHIMSGYNEALPSSSTRRETITKTMDELSRPVAMACLTTIIGFGALATSSVKPVQQFGIFTAFGVFSAMVFTMFLVPALLRLLGPRKLKQRKLGTIQGESLLTRALALLAKGVIRFRLLIVILFTLFVVTSLAITTQLQVGEDWLKNFREDSELRVSDTIVRQNLGGIGTLKIVIYTSGDRSLKEPGILKKIALLQEHLASFEGMGKIISLADMVKTINKAMNGDDPSYYRIPEEVETVTVRRWEEVDGVEREVLREEQVSGKEQVAQYLLMYENAGGEQLEAMTDYSYQTGQVLALLRTSNTIDRARIIVDTEKIVEEIFGDEENVEIKLTGLAVLDMVVVKLLMRGQILSLLVSLVICFLIIILVYRSLRVGIICLTPLVLTTLLNFAIIVLSGRTLNSGTALTASIAIGIGIDYSIHFVSRYRLLRSEGKDHDEAVMGTMQTTGKAITFNALSVTAGFLVLLLSSFIPVMDMGWLISLMMLSSAVGALTIIPAVLPFLLPKG